MKWKMSLNCHGKKIGLEYVAGQTQTSISHVSTKAQCDVFSALLDEVISHLDVSKMWPSGFNAFSRHIELCCSCGVDSTPHPFQILHKKPKKRLIENSILSFNSYITIRMLQLYTALDVDREAKVLLVGRAVEVTRGPELKKISPSPLQDLRKHLGLLNIRLTVARVLCSLGIASLSHFHTDKRALVLISSLT